ncbi:hypothetical protein TB2_026291 [Malus domestica]
MKKEKKKKTVAGVMNKSGALVPVHPLPWHSPSSILETLLSFIPRHGAMGGCPFFLWPKEEAMEAPPELVD